MVFELVLVGLVGLACGSFVGVVTKRLPQKEPFVFGRSYCPRCGVGIAACDNIPVVSFLFLRGRCRNCRQRISLRYPLIELTTALAFLAIYLKFGFDFLLFAVFLLTLAVFVIDLEKRMIPDEIVFFGLFLTIAFLVLGDSALLYEHLFAGFLSAFLLLTVHLVTFGKGMGLGDVKYALFAGTFLGLPHTLFWLFWAFLTGAGLGVILILLGKARLKSQIAFGPFLAVSFVVTIFWGNRLLTWFLTL